jgi:hypothetical protein
MHITRVCKVGLKHIPKYILTPCDRATGFNHIHTYIHYTTHTYMLSIYMHAYRPMTQIQRCYVLMHTYTQKHPLIYIHTYIHIYIHTFIHSKYAHYSHFLIHTHIHTYINTYTQITERDTAELFPYHGYADFTKTPSKTMSSADPKSPIGTNNITNLPVLSQDIPTSLPSPRQPAVVASSKPPTHTGVCVCMCVYVYVCMYVHTHIHW